MPNAKNVATYAAIKEDLQGISALWAINYSGLTVKQAEALRRQVREAGAVMKIYKNSLIKKALAELDMPSMDEVLEGPSAFIFANGDAVAAVKAVSNFAKTNKAIALKGGIMDGEFLDAAGATVVASLPSRDELLGQIACSLTQVASGIAIALGEMSEKDAA